MDDDNHSCPQFPRYTSNFALASFLLCASILMLHLKTVFRAGCALAFMFEKDGGVWQTCQGVISSSASGDNCTSLPASTSVQEGFKMWTIVNCRKAQVQECFKMWTIVNCRKAQAVDNRRHALLIRSRENATHSFPNCRLFSSAWWHSLHHHRNFEMVGYHLTNKVLYCS